MFDGIHEIARRYGDLDAAIVHLGGTTLPGGLVVTMDGEQGCDLLAATRPRCAVPVHYDDYGVFKSPLEDFRTVARQPGARGVHSLRRPRCTGGSDSGLLSVEVTEIRSRTSVRGAQTRAHVGSLPITPPRRHGSPNDVQGPSYVCRAAARPQSTPLHRQSSVSTTPTAAPLGTSAPCASCSTLNPDGIQTNISGELDFSTSARLDRIFRLVEGFDNPVLVDLSGVTFTDSTGLSPLLAICVAARGKRR